MRKNTPAPDEFPSLTKVQGKNALYAMKSKGEALLANRPILEETFDTWSQSTLDMLRRVFGPNSGHISNFCGQQRVCFVGPYGGPDERSLEQERYTQLGRRIAVLGSLLDQLETEISLESPKPSREPDSDHALWALLHAKVVTSAKARFDAGHYADAVEAALKDLNSTVKEMVKKKTGTELDGAQLMQKAFSPNAPVLIALDDLSAETGRNIQQGYMQIFSGAMIGIRNPKAHANLSITSLDFHEKEFD